MSDRRDQVPDLDPEGYLPAYLDNRQESANCPPYYVTLAALARRFGYSSPQRRAILRGFLEHRARLRAHGLVDGFQWIDGSFVEVHEGVEPNDIDVVTFYETPASPTKLPEDLLVPQLSKGKYKVDPYFVNLDSAPSLLVSNAAFWSGLWSHDKSGTQKGYLKIDLSDAEDKSVLEYLQEMENSDGSA